MSVIVARYVGVKKGCVWKEGGDFNSVVYGTECVIFCTHRERMIHCFCFLGRKDK